MKKNLFVVLMGLVATSAYADKWLIVGASDKELVLTNLSSAVLYDNAVEYWSAIVNIDKAQKHDLLMNRVAVDCNRKLWRINEALAYRKGHVIKSQRANMAWEGVIPGTTIQYAYNAVCNSIIDKNTFEFTSDDDLATFTKNLQNLLRNVAKR